MYEYGIEKSPVEICKCAEAESVLSVGAVVAVCVAVAVGGRRVQVAVHSHTAGGLGHLERLANLKTKEHKSNNSLLIG